MLPLPLPPPIGTIWLSKTTTAVTRKAIGTPLGEVRAAGLRVIRHAEQAERAAGADVLEGGELRVDHRLAGRVRVNGRPCSTFTLSVAMPTP